MEIVNKIITSAIWIVYAIYEGKREAYYYQLLAVFGVKRPNIHWLYALQRGLFLIVIGLGTSSIITPITLALIFPFFHDGFYYMKYNDLLPTAYKKRFIDQSTTSTAVMEFNWKWRCVMFILGAILLILNTIVCELFGIKL